LHFSNSRAGRDASHADGYSGATGARGESADRSPAKEGELMPQKQHLPSVGAKEQRMYEHIKESELDQGRPVKKAKAIAAATVNKHHSEKDHPRGK
jgi:ribosomal protein L15